HVDDELPDYTVANAGQILEVNQAGDAVVWADNQHLELSNSDPWTHAQYNEILPVPVSGTGMSTQATWVAEQNPVAEITTAEAFCSVFPQVPATDGTYMTVIYRDGPVYELGSEFPNASVPEQGDDYHGVYVSQNSQWIEVGLRAI
ncbi:MAG: hypothetical protein VW683_15695, partial [Betaproteobacteria bacterium]